MPLPQCQPPKHQHCPGSDNCASPIASQSCLHVFSWEHFSALLLSRKTTATLLLSKEATWIHGSNMDSMIPKIHSHQSPSDRLPEYQQLGQHSHPAANVEQSQLAHGIPPISIINQIHPNSPSNHLLRSPGRGQCSPHHKRNLHLEYRVSDCSKADKNQESLQSR